MFLFFFYFADKDSGTGEAFLQLYFGLCDPLPSGFYSIKMRFKFRLADYCLC